MFVAKNNLISKLKLEEKKGKACVDFD